MSKRKVVFEAGPMLDSHKTGVGYYVSHLMASLQDNHAASLEITGYYFNFLNRRHKQESGQLRFNKISIVPGKLISLCRRLGFQPWLELFLHNPSDTVIFTNYVSLPQLKRRKTILVVYDLSFLDMPQFTQERNLKFMKKFCPPSIIHADVIITISEFTKQRLEYHFPKLKAGVVVTPIPPPNHHIEKIDLPESLQRLGLRSGSYLLHVGTLEPRKNIVGLIDAYSLLGKEIQTNYPLVLVGGKGWKDEPILQAISEAKANGLNIIQPGYMDDAEKNALYSNAACLVMPSHYEGFGMPILEAMQYKCPVLVSDIPVFHEVAGKAALYFDKDQSQDIADKIITLINDAELQATLTDNASTQLKKLSWEDNAEKVYRVL